MAKLSEIVYPELKTTHRLNSTATATNFHVWKKKIDFVLFDNAVSYVLTDPKPPEPTDITPKNDVVSHQKWLSDDFTARHIILGAIHDDLYLYFETFSTAKSLLEALASRFAPTSLARGLALFTRIRDHRMSEETHISRHIMEMGTMVRELELAGFKFCDEMQAVMLINSLPKSWEKAMGELNVYFDGEDFTLANVVRIVSDFGESRALKIKQQGKSFKGNCYFCGKLGHRVSDCPDKD